MAESNQESMFSYVVAAVWISLEWIQLFWEYDIAFRDDQFDTWDPKRNFWLRRCVISDVEEFLGCPWESFCTLVSTWKRWCFGVATSIGWWVLWQLLDGLVDTGSRESRVWSV